MRDGERHDDRAFGHRDRHERHGGAEPERVAGRGDAVDEAEIAPLGCSLAGHEAAVNVTAGSFAEQVMGAARSVERFNCAFGPNPDHLGLLRANGLRFTGHDDDGQPRIAELPGHPFYFATLFQPELAGDGILDGALDGIRHGTRPHPVITAFATAVTAKSGG